MHTPPYITAIWSPYDTAFLPNKISASFWMTRVVELVWLVDLLVQCMTGFTHPKTGKYIVSRGTIVRRYMTHSFPLDLITLVPFDAIGGSAVQTTTLA